MGIVNASVDSFSDAGLYPAASDQAALALALVDEGADILDIGGQSAITGVPEIAVDEELGRVIPLIREIHDDRPDIAISVDAYRPAVVEAALGAGASIVNDVSGLLYPEVAGICAAHGARLVIMHTRAAPKTRLQRADLYDDVVDDVVSFLGERMAAATDAGLDEASIILDPGVDFTKTPPQTIRLLQGLDRVRALGRPLLLALSRKDFVGALTTTSPRDRLAGSLAAVAFVGWAPDTIFRVHDVRETVDLLKVIGALGGHVALDADLALADELRHQR